MGTVNEPRDHELRDRLRVRRFNQPPVQPTARGALGLEVNPRCFTLALSPFEDPDGDDHTATHWQIFEECENIGEPVVDQWRQRKNWYQGVNLQASDDLTDEVIEDLASNREYCWRARYRDEGLTWSQWSTLQRFRTLDQEQIPYQLDNPNAEEGTSGWVIERGVFESLTEMECNGISPFEGERYFVVGGVCDTSDQAELSQDIDLTPWRAQIEDQELYVSLEAHARNWNGSDLPEMGLSFFNTEGELLMDEGRAQTTQETWTELHISHLAPPSATKAKVKLYGTRMSGEDNDSYFDAVKAYITLGTSLCDPPANMQMNTEDDDTDMGISPMVDMMIGMVSPSLDSTMDHLSLDGSLGSHGSSDDLGVDQDIMISEDRGNHHQEGCAVQSSRSEPLALPLVFIILTLARIYRRFVRRVV